VDTNVTMSPSLAAIGAALAKAQAEVENANKNASNPHFRSKYADLAEVLNTVRPVLAKHGLSVVQFPGWDDGLVTVTTVLLHSSGEFMSGVSASPTPKADPQGVGAVVSYLRRYSLAAVSGIAQEDLDAEDAVRHNGHAPAQESRPAPQTDRPWRRRDEGDAPAPWDKVMPFGKTKGKKLGDLTEKDLRATIAWCSEKDAEKFADLIAACEATLNRYSEQVPLDEPTHNDALPF
jgi:hypothetical protein